MSDFKFDGFEPANTTPVPDVLFDELLSELSEAELKVLLYIIRRTAGFKKQTDAISLTQFQKGIRKRATGEILDKGCGVKDRTTIIKALATLENMGCIESTKGNKPQGDKAVSSYRIRFHGVVGKPDHPTDRGSGQTRPPWWAEPTTVVGKPDHGVVGKPDLQETVIQLNSEQETERQESISPEHESTSTPGAFAPTLSDISLSEHTASAYEEALAYLAACPGYEHIDRSHTPAEVIRLASRVLLTDAPPAESAHEHDAHPPEPPQQQALMAPVARESAKVDTGKKPRARKPAPDHPEKKASVQAERAARTRRQEAILALYGTLLGRKATRSEDNMRGAKQLAEAEATDEEITRTFTKVKKDKFWGPQMTLKVIAKFLDATVSETQTAQPARDAPKVVSSFGQPGFNFADEFYPSEAEKRAYYAAQQQSTNSANW